MQTPETTIALQCRGLTRSFGSRVAVDKLTLSVQLGDVYGFLGPNGAGKTTAMRCLLGLIQRDEGEVKLMGHDDPVEGRRHVGAIIETPAFHPWLSGRANLEHAAAYAGITDPRRVDEVLERVGLTERARDRAGTYSLGMKQRLGIARALLSKPRLLMLDEPTNGLDPKGMREMRELVRSLALNDGITIFISSHLLAEVQAICNRVGIIQQGKLVAEGVVDDLLQGSAAVVVDVGTSDDAALVAAMADFEGAWRVDGGMEGRQRIKLAADTTIARLTKYLVDKDVPIDAMVPIRRNLEDVFLELTQ